MSQPASSGKVRCTFPDCEHLFASVGEMKRHKQSAIEHDYCGRCDEDFKDEAEFMVHKVKSSKHIVCPICGLEFRSEGGRAGHIRQNHRAEQNLECCGCKDRFKTASGLIRHIEDDECPGISKARLVQEKTKKIIIKEALRAGEGSPMPIIPGPGENDDIDGGVIVNPLEYDHREAMANQPSGNGGSDKLALKHWPQLKRPTRAAPRNPVTVDLMVFPEVSIADRIREGILMGTEHLRLIQMTENDGKGPFGVGTPDAGQTLRTLQENWDPTNFFNSYIGRYICPCGAQFKAVTDFERHMLTKNQVDRGMKCPGCHRIFKTTTALVAHCESPSTRCHINHTQQYGQMIDEMSGGLIQAVGRNPDGSVKYEAGKLELTETTTVGVDINKGKW